MIVCGHFTKQGLSALLASTPLLPTPFINRTLQIRREEKGADKRRQESKAACLCWQPVQSNPGCKWDWNLRLQHHVRNTKQLLGSKKVQCRWESKIILFTHHFKCQMICNTLLFINLLVLPKLFIDTQLIFNDANYLLIQILYSIDIILDLLKYLFCTLYFQKINFHSYRVQYHQKYINPV